MHRAAAELLDSSENMMRAFLRRVPRGGYRAEDFLDDDGVSENPGKIQVAIHVDGDTSRRSSGKHRPMVRVDFTGSAAQVEGSINAGEAITYSAWFYVFRCLLAEDVPATAGLMRPVAVAAPS